jgi:hypothetical protein
MLTPGPQSFGLIVDLDDVLSGGTDDAAGIEGHGGNRLVIGKGVMNSTSAKIPNLDVHVSLVAIVLTGREIHIL